MSRLEYVRVSPRWDSGPNQVYHLETIDVDASSCHYTLGSMMAHFMLITDPNAQSWPVERYVSFHVARRYRTTYRIRRILEERLDSAMGKHGPKSGKRIWRIIRLYRGSASWSGRLLGVTSEPEPLIRGYRGSDHQPRNAQGTDGLYRSRALGRECDAGASWFRDSTWNDGDLQLQRHRPKAIRSISPAATPARLRARSSEHGTKEWAVSSREVICPPDSEGEDNDALFRIVGPFPVFVGMRTCSSQNGLEGMRPCLWKLVRRELTDWQKNRPVPVDDWDRACRTHDDCYTKKRKTKRIMKR